MLQILELELPDAAAKIAGLKEKLERFVAQQIAYEQWREKRFSPEVRELTNRAVATGQQLQREGLDRIKEQEKLRNLLDSLSQQ